MKNLEWQIGQLAYQLAETTIPIQIFLLNQLPANKVQKSVVQNKH